jgi:hypothetical protein
MLDVSAMMDDSPGLDTDGSLSAVWEGISNDMSTWFSGQRFTDRGLKLGTIQDIYHPSGKITAPYSEFVGLL